MQLSPHFSTPEFTCHHCGRINVQRGLPVLVAGLEKLRALGYEPSGLKVVSGYRCPERQAELHRADPANAAKDSQHCRCAAADVELVVPLDKVIALRVFSGIGWQWSSRNLLTRRRLVRHVDVRHASGHNPTGGTVLAPTVWQYGAR